LKRRCVLAFFKKLPACLVSIEACATSHHWSGQLQVLGHKVRLMPPACVKPYVKRQKNPPTRRRSTRPSPGPICGSSRPRRWSSRVA
jgi:transposase